MTLATSNAPKRRLPRLELTKLAAGIALILGILYGQHAFGLATRSARIDPAIPRTGLVNVVVVLSFEPERFHNERLAAYGMFSGRDRAINRIRLRQVTQERLAALASLPWVAHLEPLK